MKILSYNYSRFRNAEQLSLANDVLIATKTYDWAGNNVLNLLTWVQDSKTELENQINKLGTVNETQTVKLADNAFNDSWRRLKYVVKAYELSPLADDRANVAIISELINSHGPNLHSESYAVQNAIAKIFLKDCTTEPELVAAIAALKLDVYISNIQIALDTLLAAIAHRKDKKVNEISAERTREIRNRLMDNLDKMFKYLEVMSAITPEGELDTMIKRINESIQKIETAIKMRSHKSPELEEVEQG
tara:strand:+ start:9675 stop:10415 length:741 start_codon:yes stop_codon:yes gene_type:complete